MKSVLSTEPVKPIEKDSYINQLKRKELKEDIWQEPTLTIESSDDELVLPSDYKTQKEADI
jgi:hypothetical protein